MGAATLGVVGTGEAHAEDAARTATSPDGIPYRDGDWLIQVFAAQSQEIEYLAAGDAVSRLGFCSGADKVPCRQWSVSGSEMRRRMTCQLFALSFYASQPLRLARFWSGVLGWELADDPQDGVALLPSDDTGFRIRFLPTEEPKTVQNRMHFDLTSTSPEDQRQTVTRALGLGGRHIDIGQSPDDDHVVLADPEGNEFCVIGPDNKFLADCGFVGALACDGSQEVGYFWSEALGWPLVWDQDQETAIRSPHGGPKITWGGPPVAPKPGRNRLYFDLAPPAHGDRQAEIDRLLSLGATRIDTGQGDTGQGDTGQVVLADPDGNEFCVLTPR